MLANGKRESCLLADWLTSWPVVSQREDDGRLEAAFWTWSWSRSQEESKEVQLQRYLLFESVFDFVGGLQLFDFLKNKVFVIVGVLEHVANVSQPFHVVFRN